MKKYFNKWEKTVEFKIDDKVLRWDSSHAERGRHSKFQKLWLGSFKIASILGTNLYLLKDMDEWWFSYSTNGSHLKHYVEPTWSLAIFCVNMTIEYIFVLCFYFHFGLLSFIFCCLFCMVIRNKVWIIFSITMSFCKYYWSIRNKVYTVVMMSSFHTSLKFPFAFNSVVG